MIYLDSLRPIDSRLKSGLEPLSRFPRFDLLEHLTQLHPGKLKLVPVLKVHPKLGACSEITAQGAAQCRR